MSDFGRQGFIDHPIPWKVEWSRFGESMSHNSRSRIVDANGRDVVTIGYGDARGVVSAEMTAVQIVSAVNAQRPVA